MSVLAGSAGRFHARDTVRLVRTDSAGGRRRLRQVTFALMALVILVVPVQMIAQLWPGPTIDYTLYMHATSHWLAGSSFYEAFQLAGPYVVTGPPDFPAMAVQPILYPPVALWLFVPFTVLPAALWWLIPLAIVVWCLARLRPKPIVWPFLALCVAWPWTVVMIAVGNPIMWAVAAMSLGVVYVGPAVFVLLKPSLFPFALWGMRHRRWWLHLAAFGVLCVPFGAMWLDWLHAVRNAENTGLLYSILQVPMLAIPILAWVARTP